VECRACGESNWRPYGSYRNAKGVRRRRFCCRGCGRHQAEHGNAPDFGLSAGRRKEDLSAYHRFFQTIAEVSASDPLTVAISHARNLTGISEATASRWVHEVELDEADERTTRRRAFPPLAGVDEEAKRFLMDCLRIFRSPPPIPPKAELIAPSRVGGLAPGPDVSAQIWGALVRARKMATVLTGHPFPAWLSLSTGADDSGADLSQTDPPRNDSLADLEWHIRRQSRPGMWSGVDADKWLHEWVSNPAVLEEITRLFDLRNEDGTAIWIGPVEAWQLLFIPVQVSPQDCVIGPPDTVDPDRLCTIIEQVLHDLRPEEPEDAEDPEDPADFLAADDPRYKLRYWIRRYDRSIEVIVSTRARVVGASEFGAGSETPHPWAIRLHTHRRREVNSGFGEAARKGIAFPLSLRKDEPELLLSRGSG
jgi:hypothetical protein